MDFTQRKIEHKRHARVLQSKRKKREKIKFELKHGKGSFVSKHESILSCK
jgi:hypothetical protein